MADRYAERECWHGHDWWPLYESTSPIAEESCSICGTIRPIIFRQDEDAPMIDRPARVLDDGCETCLRSKVYCDAVTDPHNGFGLPCCDTCSHDED